MPKSLKTKIAPHAQTGPRRLPPLLRRAWFSINQAFRRRIAHLGLTPDQFTILRWLTEGDPRGLMQRQITDLMAADANTVAAILGRMEKAGLITRDVHEADRRAHRVQVNAAGRKKFAAAQRIAVELQKEVLSSLPAGQLDKFLEQLETVANACHRSVGATKKL